ncbi:hypothetical protein [Clostridium sp. ZS6]|nr:hypothetical protein [Clostridium sp. ZS6]
MNILISKRTYSLLEIKIFSILNSVGVNEIALLLTVAVISLKSIVRLESL